MHVATRARARTRARASSSPWYGERRRAPARRRSGRPAHFFGGASPSTFALEPPGAAGSSPAACGAGAERAQFSGLGRRRMQGRQRLHPRGGRAAARTGRCGPHRVPYAGARESCRRFHRRPRQCRRPGTAPTPCHHIAPRQTHGQAPCREGGRRGSQIQIVHGKLPRGPDHARRAGAVE